MRWLAALLTWLSAEPNAVDSHAPRAAAAAQVAYASMATGAPKAEGETAIVVPGGTCKDGKCPPTR